MLFLAGWCSVSPFSLLGATRVLTQLFAAPSPAVEAARREIASIFEAWLGS